MTVGEWLALDTTESKSRKGYAHFDVRTSIREKKDYILDPENIARHGFYPFIHYLKKQVKYSKKKKKRVKERDICYAAHIDRCIYQYYSFLLGERYNRRVTENETSQCAVAYRTDLHQSNIHFAKRAIDFIRTNAPCYVMIGDFTHFFDSLNHQYLKRQWCSLLEMPELPRDHYQVFKSVTHYSTWELSDLLELNHLEDTRAGRKALNEKMTVLTPEQFKANKKHIQKHKEPFGIPQGSPIKTIRRNRDKGRQVGTSNLYALHSCKGARGYFVKGKDGKTKHRSGNFLSYVGRAKGIFGKDELIDRDTRRHMGKIKKAIRGKQGNRT